MILTSGFQDDSGLKLFFKDRVAKYEDVYGEIKAAVQKVLRKREQQHIVER